MEIRAAVSADVPELMMFYDRMCEVLGQMDFLPEGNRGDFPPQSMVEEAVRERQQFVGVEDGRIVAAYLMDHDCDEAYDAMAWQVDAPADEVGILHALRVLPEYGGRGYSRRLVEHAIAEARSRGMRALRLDCIEDNEVPQRLYRSYGFEHRGDADITYPDIGVPRRFLLYELVLD